MFSTRFLGCTLLKLPQKNHLHLQQQNQAFTFFQFVFTDILLVMPDPPP